MVPASAATLLKENGYEVIWSDGIAEGWTYKQWLDSVKQEKPDLIAMETKTPVVKQHWRIINDLKNFYSSNSPLPTPHSPLIALFGDHVTALPEESMQNSKVDFVLTGGDYDFLLLNLCNHLKANKNYRLPITNYQLPRLEPGIYYRHNGQINPSTTLRIDGERSRTIKNTGPFQLNHDLNKLPFIDRDLTKWELYAYKNGNYKKLPGTYIMAGRDCWWARCKFCSWVTLYPKYRVRTPENVLDEIGMLVDKYQVKEIMDDTGTFPAGAWLEKFCQGMIERGYNKKIRIDCNMRPGCLTEKQYQLMGEAGFRLILYGLESADQNILDKINKGTRADDIVRDCQMAKEAGLEPHVTCMVGYPWETRESARKTIELAHMLFDKGWVDTLQATIVIPYPGTPLFEECQKNGWLLTEDWDRYDMKEPVIRTEMSNEEIMSLTQGLYKSFITPRFMLRKILSTRSMDDVRFLGRAGKAVLGHLRDFSRS